MLLPQDKQQLGVMYKNETQKTNTGEQLLKMVERHSVLCMTVCYLISSKPAASFGTHLKTEDILLYLKY